MILVDSSIWVDYFQSGKTPSANFDEELVKGKIAICGLILAEVLSGVRGEEEAQMLRNRLLALPYLSETRETFIKAASIYSSLRREGVTIPLSDCIVGAVAIENGCKLLTRDKHFLRIPGFGEWGIIPNSETQMTSS